MTSIAVKKIFDTARPLVEQWLDIGEQIASLREVAAAQGLDWSAIKALLKAKIQDERDDSGDGKRVRKLLERAEFAAAYADMLGLGGNMNEKNYFPDHDPETGEITERQQASVPHPGPAVQAAAEAGDAPAAAAHSQDGVSWSEDATPSDSASAAGAACNPVPAVTELPDMPGFLMRKKMKWEAA